MTEETKQDAEKIEKLKKLFEKVDDASPNTIVRLKEDIYKITNYKNFSVLLEELDSENTNRVAIAASIAGRVRYEDSVQKLTELLKHDDPTVREEAAFALGYFQRADVTPELSFVIGNDVSPEVRRAALQAYANSQPQNLEASLINIMNDGEMDNIVVKEAAGILSKKGTPKALPILLRRMLSGNNEVAQACENAVDRILNNTFDADYLLLVEHLTLRERRIILNYLENRNLQYVYPKLTEILHRGSLGEENNTELSKYGRILTSEFERPYIFRAFHRENVVEEILNHFLSNNRRSILMLGEPGVGKTAIIHEVVQRLIDISEKEAATNPQKKWTVIETSTTELITDTKFLGEWETKLKKMIETIEAHQNNVLLYLTNPNGLIGAGTHSNSDENFADFFRPHLQRGRLKIITESTEDELRKGLSQDPGFLRLFKQVTLTSTTKKETTDILQSILKHDELELQRHQRANKPEDSNQNDRKKRRKSPLATASDEQPTITKFVASEAILKSIVHYASSFITRSEAPGNAIDLLNQIVEMKRIEWEKESKVKIPANVTINPHDVTQCLSQNSGLPLTIIDPSVPLDLEATRNWFSERLVAQDDAINEIVNRLAIIKTGLNDPNRPLAVYFLVGPTGVGKTYFAKLLAEYLFGDQERLIRYDLSEYQSYNALEKLIGSPHSRTKSGLLTEKVRNHPFSVVLLDEFEKASKDIFPLFLQVFDEARLSNADGKTTDFKQTVILITSNLGASKTSVSGIGFGSESRNKLRDRMSAKLNEFFAPEFLNRLDQVIPFDPLPPDAIDRLVTLEVEKLRKRRGIDADGLKITMTDEALKWIAENGFSDKFGARHLRRVLENDIMTPIAKLLISNTKKPSYTTIEIDKADNPNDGNLTATWQKRRRRKNDVAHETLESDSKNPVEPIKS